MNRIYITREGLKGDSGSYTDCSYTEKATLKDVESLISDLNSQVKDLKELYFLFETVGEDTLSYWIALLARVVGIRDRIEAAQKYEDNPNIKGTYYKSCFETKAVDDKELIKAEKTYSLTVPSRAKKYLEQGDINEKL